MIIVDVNQQLLDWQKKGVPFSHRLHDEIYRASRSGFTDDEILNAILFERPKDGYKSIKRLNKHPDIIRAPKKEKIIWIGFVKSRINECEEANKLWVDFCRRRPFQDRMFSSQLDKIRVYYLRYNKIGFNRDYFYQTGKEWIDTRYPDL